MTANYVASIYPRLRLPDGSVNQPDPIISFDNTTGSVRWVVDGTGEANISLSAKDKEPLIGRLQTNRYELWVFRNGLCIHRGIITNLRDKPNQSMSIESRDWSYLWKKRLLNDDIGPNLITGDLEGSWDVSELAEALVRSGMRKDWHEPNPQIIIEKSGQMTNASVAKNERRFLESAMGTIGSIVDWTIIAGVLYIFGPRTTKSFELSTMDFRDEPYIEMDGLDITSDVIVEGKSTVNGRVKGSATSDRTWGLGEEYISSDYPDDASADAAAASILADSDQPKVIVSNTGGLRDSLNIDPRLLVPGSLGVIHVDQRYVTYGSYDVRVTETQFDWNNGTDDDVEATDEDTSTGISMTLVSPGAGYYKMKSRNYARALPGFLERLDSRLSQLEKDRVDGRTFDGTRKQVDQIQDRLAEYGLV